MGLGHIARVVERELYLRGYNYLLVEITAVLRLVFILERQEYVRMGI